MKTRARTSASSNARARCPPRKWFSPLSVRDGYFSKSELSLKPSFLIDFHGFDLRVSLNNVEMFCVISLEQVLPNQTVFHYAAVLP